MHSSALSVPWQTTRSEFRTVLGFVRKTYHYFLHEEEPKNDSWFIPLVIGESVFGRGENAKSRFFNHERYRKFYNRLLQNWTGVYNL